MVLLRTGYSCQKNYNPHYFWEYHEKRKTGLYFYDGKVGWEELQWKTNGIFRLFGIMQGQVYQKWLTLHEDQSLMARTIRRRRRAEVEGYGFSLSHLQACQLHVATVLIVVSTTSSTLMPLSATVILKIYEICLIILCICGLQHIPFVHLLQCPNDLSLKLAY